MKFILSLIVFLFVSMKGYTQNNICPDSIVYYTIDLGDGETQLAIPLKFKVLTDSIIIKSDALDERPSLFDVSFKIIAKTCSWDSDFTNGVSLYQVELNSDSAMKKAIINIQINNKKGQIQLLYEDSEPRIFTIKH